MRNFKIAISQCRFQMKTTADQIQKVYKPIDPKAHKGTQGHALLIGGSYGKMGSICLSVKAALRSGAGLATAFIPECGYEIMQVAVPEAMVLTDMNEHHLTGIDFELRPQAIGIGPGIGKASGTQKAVHKFLRTNDLPLVIDADALNILADNKSWLDLLQPGNILTPHPKELERLVGPWKSDSEKWRKVTALSLQSGVIVVCKDAPTVIVDGQKTYENTTGNAALATAGSGDVLTGIITALLAQGYSPLDAAQLAVYLHGLTADIAVKRMAAEAFVASDIIDNLGVAFRALKM
jgi:hydroxyethylthiazole kinase-like uncharacterized protein yjeF